jgi:hypothetical protein
MTTTDIPASETRARLLALIPSHGVYEASKVCNVAYSTAKRWAKEAESGKTEPAPRKAPPVAALTPPTAAAAPLAPVRPHTVNIEVEDLPLALRAFGELVEELIARKKSLPPRDLIRGIEVIGNQIVAIKVLGMPIDEVRQLNESYQARVSGQVAGGEASPRQLGAGSGEGEFTSEGDPEELSDDLALDPPA